MPGIIDLPNFNDKDLEEIFGGGQGKRSAYVYNYIHTHCAYAIFHTSF